MTVRFVFSGEESRYCFHPSFIKNFSSFKDHLYGLKSEYGIETEMYLFLDSVISPSDLERVLSFFNGDSAEISLIFNIDHVSFEDIERYLIPLEDDLPL